MNWCGAQQRQTRHRLSTPYAGALPPAEAAGLARLLLFLESAGQVLW